MARLPVDGGDEGSWGTILNDYLLQSHNSDGTLKDDVVSTDNISGTLPQSKIQNLASDLADKVGTTDVRLTDQVGYYPPGAHGFFATTVPLRDCNLDSTFGELFLTRMWVPAGKTITSLSCNVTVAGTVGAGGANGFAVYDDSGAMVAATPSDDFLWASTGWRTKALTTPITEQSSGRYVYVALVCSGYSSPPRTLYNNNYANQVLGGVGMSATKRHNIYNAVTTLPASFNPDTYASGNTYLPFIGLA